MNSEAQRIGMSGSHFANPNGLHDPNNYSTAHDLAVLGVQLRREFPQYAHYFELRPLIPETARSHRPITIFCSVVLMVPMA